MEYVEDAAAMRKDYLAISYAYKCLAEYIGVFGNDRYAKKEAVRLTLEGTGLAITGGNIAMTPSSRSIEDGKPPAEPEYKSMFPEETYNSTGWDNVRFGSTDVYK